MRFIELGDCFIYVTNEENVLLKKLRKETFLERSILDEREVELMNKLRSKGLILQIVDKGAIIYRPIEQDPK